MKKTRCKGNPPPSEPATPNNRKPLLPPPTPQMTAPLRRRNRLRWRWRLRRGCIVKQAETTLLSHSGSAAFSKPPFCFHYFDLHGGSAMVLEPDECAGEDQLSKKHFFSLLAAVSRFYDTKYKSNKGTMIFYIITIPQLSLLNQTT